MTNFKKHLWIAGLALCALEVSAQPIAEVKSTTAGISVSPSSVLAEPGESAATKDARLLAKAGLDCPFCALKVAEAKEAYSAKCGREPTAHELRAIALFDLHYSQASKPVIQCF